MKKIGGKNSAKTFYFLKKLKKNYGRICSASQIKRKTKSGNWIILLFTALINYAPYKARVFVSHFHPSLKFARKIGTNLSGVP
jgi:hypothetical protein